MPLRLPPRQLPPPHNVLKFSRLRLSFFNCTVKEVASSQVPEKLFVFCTVILYRSDIDESIDQLWRRSEGSWSQENELFRPTTLASFKLAAVLSVDLS